MNRMTPAQAAEILRFGIVNYKDGKAIAALVESQDEDAAAMREALEKERKILTDACLSCANEKPRSGDVTLCSCIVTRRIQAIGEALATTSGSALLNVVRATEARAKERWCKGEMPKASCDGCTEYEICAALAAYRGGTSAPTTPPSPSTPGPSPAR